MREGEGPILAGRMAGVLAVITRLPRQVWYAEDQPAHDQRCWDRVLASLERGMRLIFDLGFLHFTRFDELTTAGVFLLTRKAERVVARTQQVVRTTDTLRDQVVRLGSRTDRHCAHPVRLVEWRHQGKW